MIPYDKWEEHRCPRCGKLDMWRDSADVGVGIIYGPWGCPHCGWSEDEKYDLQKGGGVQADGSYLDPYGGLLPATNSIAKMLAKGVIKKIGKDLTKDMKALMRYTGTNSDGERALVQQTDSFQYAQFNDPEHEKALGWWQFPLGTFRPDPDTIVWSNDG